MAAGQQDGMAGDDALLPPWNGRAVMLVDLDAFFASVEQLDHPDWRGKPVIVGGDPDRRGVVSTASYEARAYGVHSAMPSSTARRLCPDAIWTPGHFSRYREMSERVMDILNDESPFMQQVSVDEAFLAVTPTRYRKEHPVLVARRIRRRVRELGVTCSIGLGVSKSVAKIASDEDKPDGLTVVYPGREEAYLAQKPLSAMSGIGAVAQRKLLSFGMRYLGEVAHGDPALLAQVFGRNAEIMRLRCLGRDESPVQQDDEVKSVSAEMSFAKSLEERKDIVRAMQTMASKVCRRLRKKDLQARTIMLKLRYEDLKIRTAQVRCASPTADEYLMADELESLIDSLWAPGMLVRLVGVAASGFGDKGPESPQASLFGEEQADAVAGKLDSRKREGLMRATDRIRDRFGEHAVNFGREAATLGTGTGTAPKNPDEYRT